jgi:hypothetical protein
LRTRRIEPGNWEKYREITRRRAGEAEYGPLKKGEFQIILCTLNIEPELVPKLTDVKAGDKTVCAAILL